MIPIVPIRVILADDHPVFRSGLRALLDQDAGIRVVAEAADGDAALVEIRAHRPDIAVLDLDMPNRDAFGVVTALGRDAIPTGIVLLTAHRDEALVNRAWDLGIRGLVLKDSAVGEIAGCIRAVHRGDTHISARVSGALLNRSERSVPTGPGLGDLTPTERRILAMIADQQSTRQIADALCISVRTVDRHRSNLCDKLDLHGPTALIKFAIANRR